MTASERPWESGIEPTAEEAAELIARQFPEIDARVTRIGRGWDNTAFVTADDIVFRFPRRAETARLMETEVAVLPALAGHLPLAVPDPRWVGAPDVAFPFLFAGYRRLPGRPASEARLDADARLRAAPVLGAFLAALHRIPPPADVPGDVLHRRDFRARMPLMIKRLEVLRTHGIIERAAPWLALFADLSDAEPPGRDTLVHGDLYARHILIEDDVLTGVIDWGDVHAGDAAMDLMMVYGFLPAQARPAFFESYGAVAPDVLRTARLRAAFHAVSVTWYGREQGVKDLLEEGRSALAFVLEDGPAGPG